MYLDDDRRPALTPQLAMRVAIIGGIALVAFSVIFFRLWYLQVLSSDKYLAEANDNRVREIKVQAPRGEIVDRNGTVLVDNRSGYAVKVTPENLPDDPAERSEVYRRLAKLLDMRPGRVERRAERQLRALPYATAIVKQDVPDPLVWYLLEHERDYPGVAVERVFLREYPHGTIGAHLFGHVGEVTEDQLGQERYLGVVQGDRVGQDGIEYQYDRYLRGRNGATRVQVDALGNLNRKLDDDPPEQGRQLRLSVDLEVQEAGQAALATGTGKGAFAVLDVHTGEVIALGSQPSFDPNVFSKALSPSEYDRMLSEENGAPLTNRAIQGGYPTGSTFKLVTAMAAMESGLLTPDEVVYDGGSLRIGDQEFKNAGDAVFGPVALRQALTVSSDVFFYKLGQEADSAGDGLAIQHWARKLGVGRVTGIDLPGELPGLVPTPKWRNSLVGTGVGDDRPWTVGDNVNLSVGQGDLKASPLQMAVAYATVANGGRVLKPRLGMRIEDSSGRALQQLESPTARRLELDPAHTQAIMDGLYGAANLPGGTSTTVFEGFPVDIAGKTGTAEKGLGRADQSWYLALAPYPDPQYVVAVTDEAGGFGAETAAPMARQILAALLEVQNDEGSTGGEAPD